MGNIRSTVGNITHNVQDTISSVLNTASIKMENIVGTVQTGLTNMFSGGFIGMSADGMAELTNILRNYCEEVQGIISGFDQTGDITSALKGDVQDAAYDFIAAIKQLLEAYVSRMLQEIDEANQAYENFMKSGQSISQDVQTAAQDIRSNADEIRLD